MSTNVQLDLDGVQESSTISSYTSVPGSNKITVTLADGVVVNVPEQPACGGHLVVNADNVNAIIANGWAGGCTSTYPATNQVETATIAGTITVAGNVKITVTAAGMTNSPKDVIVAVAAGDSAATVGGKVRTALAADVDVAAFFTVGGSSATVTLTALTAASNDATMNIASASHRCAGLTGAASSANTTSGVASVLQVETATVAGTVTGDGNATVVVTAAGMTGSPETVSVAVLNNDTAATVGGKIRTALAANTHVNDFFTVSGSTTAVILTARTAAANDGTMNISIDNGTCTGLTTAATSANTTAGVAGVLQIETATIAGTVTTSGDADIIVTAAGMTNSPKTIRVLLAAGDTAAAAATKIRTALAADTNVDAFFTVGGSTTAVALTAKTKAANDATMNIAFDNGGVNGLTAAATSTNTTAGWPGGAKTVSVYA